MQKFADKDLDAITTVFVKTYIYHTIHAVKCATANDDNMCETCKLFCMALVAACEEYGALINKEGLFEWVQKTGDRHIHSDTESLEA
jgi:hypothetical protein